MFKPALSIVYEYLRADMDTVACFLNLGSGTLYNTVILVEVRSTLYVVVICLAEQTLPSTPGQARSTSRGSWCPSVTISTIKA
jgi:hypothetical protein